MSQPTNAVHVLIDEVRAAFETEIPKIPSVFLSKDGPHDPKTSPGAAVDLDPAHGPVCIR